MLKCFLGIDIGTTISKGTVLSFEGEVIFEFQTMHNYRNDIDFSTSWLLEVKQIIKHAVNNINDGKIIAVAISAMAPNLIFVNESGDIVEKTHLFTDDFAEDLQNELDSKDGTKWKNETLSKIIKIKETSIFWGDIYKILTTHNYIAYKLSGKFYCDLPTAFEYGNLFNEKTKNWDKFILNKYGIELELFPEIVEPVNVLGTVLPEIANELGLSKETVIVAGTHDSVASMIGAGLENKGDVFLYYGTFNCSALLRDSILDVLYSMNLKKSPIEWTASIPSAGPQISQLSEIFAGNYESFDKKVELSSPGANGLLFFSHDNLLKTGISSKPNGCYANISLSCNLNDFCRAVYEAFPYALYAFWSTSEIEIQPNECYISGGGARSDIRIQITSDILKITQIKLHNAENSVGTSLIALAAISMEQFLIVQKSRKDNAIKYYPEIKDETIYEQMIQKYKYFLTNNR